MKRFLFCLALAAGLLALLAAPAFASGEGATCSTATTPPPPAGSHLVMNVTEGFINQEDAGSVGYWALDNGVSSVMVWQVPDGSFYTILRPLATFTTFAGVPSPNCDANGLPLEKGTGTGTFSGWIVFTFTASSYTPKFGYLGVFNDQGSKADILLGWYDLQQGPYPADLISFMNYFPGGLDTLNATALYQVYRYGCQTMVSTLTSGTGNIVVGR
jgi:hypothetical protein